MVKLYIAVVSSLLEVIDTDYMGNTASIGGEIGSACNSQAVVPYDIMISKDPERPHCNLYDSNVTALHIVNWEAVLQQFRRLHPNNGFESFNDSYVSLLGLV